MKLQKPDQAFLMNQRNNNRGVNTKMRWEIGSDLKYLHKALYIANYIPSESINGSQLMALPILDSLNIFSLYPKLINYWLFSEMNFLAHWPHMVSAVLLNPVVVQNITLSQNIDFTRPPP